MAEGSRALRPTQLRKLQAAELKAKVMQLKEQLVTDREAQEQSKEKLNVRTTRKAIARALTVYNEKRRAAAKASFRGKKFIPKEMRPKLTRALRRALTPEQLALKPKCVSKRLQNMPVRKYAVLA